MRPLRTPPDDFEIRALCRCRSCGKTRELASDQLYGAASMDSFKELEQRLRCTDCGERAVSVEPIWHADWESSSPSPYPPGQKMITARQYYDEVARPTFEEFYRDNKSLRLAMNAAAAVLHVVDYVMQNRAPDARTGDALIAEYKKVARQSFCFEVIEAFALASKHCNLSSRPNFDSGRHMVAYPAFVGELTVGQSFIGDTVGGITVEWSNNQFVNLTIALDQTMKLLESNFGELTN